MRSVAISSSVLLALSTLSFDAASAPPSGSWAAFGHDFQRTGRADGTGDMHAPSVAWTMKMGALLSQQQALLADLNGDGRLNIVAISGGRVVASGGDGSTLWAGGLVGAQSLLGAWDLDGDGATELVVDTTSGVLVLGGRDGRTLSTIAVSEPVGAVFAAEPPHGGILVLAASRGAVSGYDFREGTGVTTPTYTITGANQTSNVVGDVDGDGAPDLVRPLDDGFEVDDPLTGAVKYSLPGMSPPAYYYLYGLTNVDGQPGDEIVALDTSYIYSPTCGIYVASVKGGVLKLLWSTTASPTVARGADFFSVTGSTVDLDGDGTIEIVYSQWDATAASWTTHVSDGVTGGSLGTIPGAFVQAVADIDGDGKKDVVVRSEVTGDQTPAHSTLSAYAFPGRQIGLVAKPWTLAAAHVLSTTQVQPPGPGLPVSVAADFDPAAPGLELLVGTDTAGTGTDTRIVSVHGSDGTVASSYVMPATVQPSVLGWGNRFSGAASLNDIVVAQDDGTIHVLDRSLADRTNLGAGSYASWTYAIVQPQGHANLFSATSNNHLKWIDGRQLHADGSPYVRFDEPAMVSTGQWAAQGYPMDPVVLLGGNSQTLVTYAQSSTHVTLVGHDATGVEIWRSDLDNGTQVVPPGAYTLDLTGDGNDDILVSLQSVKQVQGLAVFDGVSGALVRSTPVASIVPAADVLATGSLADVNGDGRLDLITPVHNQASQIAIDLSVQPFGSLWLAPTTTPNGYNGTVGVAPLAGNGPEIFRSNGNNGFGPYERLSLAGSVIATNDPGLPLVHGLDLNAAALLPRGTTAFDLATAGSADAALSRIRRIAGDTMTTLWTVYAANGTVSAGQPPRGFALHDLISFDVDGNGVTDVVFGSDDGYIYALRGDDGSQIFAVNLDAPVAHVIGANIDLDPALELVVSLADGRLVALDDHYSASRDQSDAGPDGSADGSDTGVPVPEAGGIGDAACEGLCDDGGSEGARGSGCLCRAIPGSPISNDGPSVLGGLIALAAVRRVRLRRRSTTRT